MPNYCVNKHGDHEVHKISDCNHLPNESNRYDFYETTDYLAMEKARMYYADADGCAYCMPIYHNK